jgi:hypothetical protein
MTTTTTTDLGGTVVERDIPGVGLLRFEDFAPGQWLTQKGTLAKKSKRRYAIGDTEYDSVSSIVGTLDKPALVNWAEDHGARGGAAAQRMGELDGVPEEEIIERVRLLGLGASAKRDGGADRGHAIHAAFESLARFDMLPKREALPQAWWPWLQGCAGAWLELAPSPVEIEDMVAHPLLGYAGRPDLVARVDNALTLIDYKTGKGKVYDQAHYQTRLYEMARVACGLTPVDRIVIVGIDDQGGYQLVECEASEQDALCLLHTFRSRKRINAGMAAQRKALKAGKGAR